MQLDLDNWFVTGEIPPALRVAGDYEPSMVVLSLVVAVASSWVALLLAGQARGSHLRLNRLVAQGSGAIALGAGVWAMHFIGMLAFQLCAPVRYDPVITAASMVPSLGAAWVALRMLAQPTITAPLLLGSGVTVGAGIGAMHYGGMVAMEMAPNLVFDVGWFLASIVVAVVLAVLALWIGFGLGRHAQVRGRVRLLAGVVMGLAITGMHYTGMAAARFVGVTDPAFDPDISQQIPLATAVAVVALTMGGIAFAANTLLRLVQVTRKMTESEARLSAVVETAADGIISIDRHGMIRSFNGSAERIFGWTASEVVGDHVGRLITEEDGRHLDAYLERCLRSGVAQTIGTGREVTGLRRDGSRVPLRLAVSHTEVGGEALFTGMVADISERKAFEQALEEREARYRTLIANLPGVAFRYELGSPGKLVFISDAVEAQTGWPPAHFLGEDRGHLRLTHPEDLERITPVIQAAIGEGGQYTVEYRIHRRDGTERWLSHAAGCVRDAAGTVRWIDGVTFDITETRKRNAEYQSIATVLDRALAVLEIGTDGRILRGNANYLAMMGFGSEDEVVGSPYVDRMPPRLRETPAYQGHLQAMLRGEVVVGEFQRVGKDGRELWVQSTYNPVHDENGRLQKIMAFKTDITPRKRMERELREAMVRAEQAAAARSSFLANMSHEIRTPMNAIMGFTDVLLTTQLAPAQRRHLETVRNAAQSLLSLLNDILDTAKLEKGAMELEMEDFSLRSLCEQVAASMRLGAEKKGLQLSLDYPDTLPDYFRGDALRVQQVLVNLVGNAIKFTEQGSVGISVSQRRSDTVIAIRDTGVGIPADRVDRIFDAFAQADATVTRKFGGTGLGTTIARQLVELMGGRILVSSEVGVGSCFEVCIPLAVGHAPPIDALPSELNLPPLDILVADDVAQNLELLEIVLGSDGHRVVTAGNGQEAVQKLQAGRFDVVLMDMHMPVLDGLGATRAIRTRERDEGLAPTPVIALTASVQAVDRHAALEAGMDGFATKPVVKLQLQKEIARVLGLREATVPAALMAEDEPPVVSEYGALVDWTQGLALWQTEARLCAAIGAFLRSHEATPQALRGLMAQADLPGLAALGHRIGGAAGNLALRALREAAQALEAAARAGDAARTGHGVEQVVQQLHAARMVAVEAEEPDILVTGPDDIDPAQTLARLAQLREALLSNALDEASLEALNEALPPSQLRELLEAIDNFDFQRAAECVDALQQSLQEDLKGK